MTPVNDPLFSQQWGLHLINAPEAWEITRGSPDVVVAIIEKGIDVAHPDLAGCLVVIEHLSARLRGATVRRERPGTTRRWW